MCAQVAPSGECLRVISLVRLFPAAYNAACGSFLPVLNLVLIPGLRAGICCAVLRDSLYVCIILCNQCAIVKLDYYRLLYYYYYYTTRSYKRPKSQ